MDFYVCFYASVTSAPVPADLSLVKDCRLDLSLCTEYHKLRTSLEPAKDQQLSWSRVRTVTYCSQASQGLHRTKGCRQLSAQPQGPRSPQERSCMSRSSLAGRGCLRPQCWLSSVLEPSDVLLRLG